MSYVTSYDQFSETRDMIRSAVAATAIGFVFIFVF